MTTQRPAAFLVFAVLACGDPETPAATSSGARGHIETDQVRRCQTADPEPATP